MTATQTEEGLLFTFQFNHFDFVTYPQPFSLHTVQLRLAYYPNGLHYTMGLKQTVFANPLQPEVEENNAGDKPILEEITRPLIPVICGIVDGRCDNAESWVKHWHQEGQKYINRHQQQLEQHELSAWQQATYGNITGSTAEYLGAKAAYPHYQKRLEQ